MPALFGPLFESVFCNAQFCFYEIQVAREPHGQSIELVLMVHRTNPVKPGLPLKLHSLRSSVN